MWLRHNRFRVLQELLYICMCGYSICKGCYCRAPEDFLIFFAQNLTFWCFLDAFNDFNLFLASRQPCLESDDLLGVVKLPAQPLHIDLDNKSFRLLLETASRTQPSPGVLTISEAWEADSPLSSSSFSSLEPKMSNFSCVNCPSLLGGFSL